MNPGPDRTTGALDSPSGDIQQLRAERDAALSAAQSAMRDTTRLTRLLTVLSEPAPLESLLDRVLSTLSELFAADIVAILDPVDAGSLVARAAIGLPEDVLRLPFSEVEGDHVAAVMRDRVPLLVQDVAGEDGGTGQLGGQGARTAVWVPVTDSESARGALVLARCRPAPFTHAEAGLLMAMAYRIGLALEQAQHSRQLERAVAAGLELRGHLDEAEVQREVARLLPGVVAGDAGVLVSLEGDGGARWVAQHGLENAYACEWERLTNHLLANGLVTPSHSFTAPDLREVTDWPPGERGCPIRALLAAPIRWQGTLCGMLYALRFTTRPFTPDAAQVAMLYAAQASAALENARLYRAIRGELSERARAEQEVRQSEERLKLALEGGALGMWDWHVGTNRVRVDQRWSQIVGRHPHREEVDLQEYLARVHPDERRLVTDGLLAHIRGMTPQYEIEHRLLRDGEPDLWLLARGRVTQWDDAGQPVRVVGTIMDVTVARQIHADRLTIETQRQQVWRAESLSRMAGGIAHHFNNFLGAVIGNLELALDQLPPESLAAQRIGDAAEGAWRASEVSRLMLAYLGQPGGRREPIDLAESARQAVSLLSSTIPGNVRLRTELPERGPTVLGQGAHIKQILDNLVSNAVEAIGDRTGEITVAVRHIAADQIRGLELVPPDWTFGAGEHVCVSVSDNGGGIDPVHQQRIFDPFFSTKFTGRGLGLSVVLGLVRSHGGALAVESQPGHGSTFRLIFPVSFVEEQSEQGDDALSAETEATPATVLLIDDEPMVLRVARAQLERLGFTVVTADDGFEAIDYFREHGFEIGLVLLDLAMPGMDGWAALLELRALQPGVRVILTSGYDEAQVMEGSHAERPQAFLQKPYDLQDLQRAVAQAFAR